MWAKLLKAGKIGYFALLRNLRNVLATAPELTDVAIEMLTDKRLIAKSLVMPFRFTTALEALQGSGLPNAGRVLDALSTAVDISLANVPRFDGKTLVALDGSGSMMGRPIKIGSLFAAAGQGERHRRHALQRRRALRVHHAARLNAHRRRVAGEPVRARRHELH